MANVSTPTKRYKELHDKCDLPRALMGGTAEMVEEGTEFLPQHPAESDAAYEVRLKGTTLYNGFADTVKKMTGKVFSKPINTEQVAPQLQPLLGNIDGAGRDINSFGYDLFKEGMVDGIDFVLVDFPPIIVEGGRQATMADQLATGARPYTVLVKAEQVIGWRSRNIGGAQVLTEVRIEEKFVEEGEDWTEKEIHQIRVLRPGSFEVYRKSVDANNKESWISQGEGKTSLDFIPLIPLYINRVGFFEGEPPLMALAELNLEHWISSSEQRKALTFARFAMLALTGVDAESEVEVGPDKILKLPQGATANYVESTGAAISAGREDLAAIEKRMQHAGMTIRVQTATGVTATAAAIDSVDADSALMAAAKSLQDTLNQVLFVMGKYLGLPDGGSVIVDTGFGKVAPTGTIAELVQLYMAGALPLQLLVQELKRRGTIAEDTDVEEVLGMLGSQF